MSAYVSSMVLISNACVVCCVVSLPPVVVVVLGETVLFLHEANKAAIISPVYKYLVACMVNDNKGITVRKKAGRTLIRTTRHIFNSSNFVPRPDLSESRSAVLADIPCLGRKY